MVSKEKPEGGEAAKPADEKTAKLAELQEKIDELLKEREALMREA